MRYFTTLILVLFVLSCDHPNSKYSEEINEISIAVKKEFAPDKRVAIWQTESMASQGKWVIKGETNLPRAKRSFLEKLEGKGIAYIDSIELLPSTQLGEKIYAVVNISVANIRTNPKHSAELTTQATLGTPLKVWDIDDSGDFYRVQTPDGYIAWVDHGGIVRMREEDFNNYKAKEKVIFKEAFGFSFSQMNPNSQPISDLVLGNILTLEQRTGSAYKVSYPDGRVAFIDKAQAEIYSGWTNSLTVNGSSLMSLSQNLMGFPYLWGGTSAKGMDCSGFTKTVYFMNGMVIPRDASQQVHVGELVDEKGDFSKLQVGDLLFFYGRPPDHPRGVSVVHVGMWIGNMQMIHASGKIHVSSFDPKATNYDKKNHNRYYRAMRILGSDREGVKYMAKGELFE